MMQTRSNNGPVEDPTLGQASGGDNGSTKSSSCGTIPDTWQRFAEGDAPPVGKGVQLLGGQEAFKNPSAIDAEDPIEVDTPSGNEKSGGEDENEIATEIERLKKEQKKVQMRTKLRCLKKHKAQEFIKDVPEQESYMQKLALKKAKKICDLDVYSGESQCALDKYVNQVDLVFWTKLLIYTNKETKCFYTAVFLGSIL